MTRHAVQLCLLVLLVACGGTQATPTTPPPPPAATTPTPAGTDLAGDLLWQLRDYERVYYANRSGNDWSRLDRALEPWLAKRPVFAWYYRWVRMKYRRENRGDLYRTPAVLRAEISDYVVSATPPGRLRQTISTTSVELTLLSVERLGNREIVWSQASDVLRPSGVWVAVLIRVTNTRSQAMLVTPQDFAVEDLRGRLYQSPAHPGALAYSPNRGYSKLAIPLAPGADDMYWLLFDVAPDASGLVLIFDRDTRPVFQLWW